MANKKSAKKEPKSGANYKVTPVTYAMVVIIILLVVVIFAMWLFGANNANNQPATNQNNIGQNTGTPPSGTGNNPLLIPVNGECGPTAKQYGPYDAFSKSGYCTQGSLTPAQPSTPTPEFPSFWRCIGSNGGTNADCSATKMTTTDIVSPASALVRGCQNGWNNTDQSIQIQCSDTGGSGCSSITYGIDNSNWRTVSVSPPGNSIIVNISGDGNHTITYISKDKAGNVESPQNLAFCAIRYP